MKIYPFLVCFVPFKELLADKKVLLLVSKWALTHQVVGDVDEPGEANYIGHDEYLERILENFESELNLQLVVYLVVINMTGSVRYLLIL